MFLIILSVIFCYNLIVINFVYYLLIKVLCIHFTLIYLIFRYILLVLLPINLFDNDIIMSWRGEGNRFRTIFLEKNKKKTLKLKYEILRD